MKIIDRVTAAFNALAGRPLVSKRSYEGAGQDRLTSDWGSTVTSADAEMRNDLGALRSRWRELERDNGTGARYLNLLENNIIGPDGIGLHMHITDPSGALDTKACGIVEDAWLKWERREFCTLTGMYSWDTLCRLVLRSAARDGSALVIIIEGPEAGNPFGFTLKPLEGDHLDRFYSGYAPNGNEVRLGVEYDKDSWGQRRRPVAYWITPRHPGDYIGYSGNYTRRRIPAEQVIHLFNPLRIGQSDGVPWGTAAMTGLRDLGQYTQAELVAARMGACVTDYIEMTTGEEYEGDAKDANGQPLTDMQPGAVKVLPKGATVKSNDPKHPNASFDSFVKSVKRDNSGGLDIDYESLSNDRSDVNFSSIRAGLLDTRDSYRKRQNWFVEGFVQRVFDRWFPVAMLSGEIALPFAKFDKFNKPTWKCRSWDWVDPLKDMTANVMAIANRLKSPQSIISERGGDAEKILKEIEEWEKMLKAKGLAITPAATAAPVEFEDDEEPEKSKKPSRG